MNCFIYSNIWKNVLSEEFYRILPLIVLSFNDCCDIISIIYFQIPLPPQNQHSLL